jgi:hypothetical protein
MIRCRIASPSLEVYTAKIRNRVISVFFKYQNKTWEVFLNRFNGVIDNIERSYIKNWAIMI